MLAWQPQNTGMQGCQNDEHNLVSCGLVLCLWRTNKVAVLCNHPLACSHVAWERLLRLVDVVNAPPNLPLTLHLVMQDRARFCLQSSNLNCYSMTPQASTWHFACGHALSLGSLLAIENVPDIACGLIRAIGEKAR